MEKHFMDSIIGGLKKTVSELEDLQVQFALGKAEASGKYEQAKKKFDSLISDAKSKIHSGGEKAIELSNKLSELEQVFEQKVSEAKKDLKEEVKKFERTVEDIETSLKE